MPVMEKLPSSVVCAPYCGPELSLGFFRTTWTRASAEPVTELVTTPSMDAVCPDAHGAKTAIQRKILMLLGSAGFERDIPFYVIAFVEFDFERLIEEFLGGLRAVASRRTGNDQPVFSRTQTGKTIRLSAGHRFHVIVDMFDAVGNHHHRAADRLPVFARDGSFNGAAVQTDCDLDFGAVHAAREIDNRVRQRFSIDAD